MVYYNAICGWVYIVKGVAKNDTSSGATLPHFCLV